MAKFIVSAPEAAYAGTVGNVQFRDGKAEIDDERNPAELAYCRSAGYRVDEADAVPDDAGQDRTTPDSDKPFDPAEHNADEVMAYLNQADEAEATRVLDAEADGKNRKGITDKRDQILASKKEEK